MKILRILNFLVELINTLKEQQNGTDFLNDMLDRHEIKMGNVNAFLKKEIIAQKYYVKRG